MPQLPWTWPALPQSHCQSGMPGAESQTERMSAATFRPMMVVNSGGEQWLILVNEIMVNSG